MSANDGYLEYKQAERGRYGPGQYPQPHDYGPRSPYGDPYSSEQERKIYAWNEARQDPVHYMVWLVDQHIDLLEKPLRAAWNEVRHTILDPGDASALQRAATAWDGTNDNPTTQSASDPHGSLVSRFAISRVAVGTCLVELLDSWEGDAADALKVYNDELLDRCFEVLQENFEHVADSLRALSDAIDAYSSGVKRTAVTSLTTVFAAGVAEFVGSGSLVGSGAGRAMKLAAKIAAISTFAYFATESTFTFLDFKADCRSSLGKLMTNIRTFNGYQQALDGRWPRPGRRIAEDSSGGLRPR